MAFILSKKSERNGKIRELYYLVENYRVRNKIKRRKLLSLNECKSLAELLETTEQEEAGLLTRLNRKEKELDEFIKTGKTPQTWLFGSLYFLRKNLEWIVEKTKVDLKECQTKKDRIKSFM